MDGTFGHHSGSGTATETAEQLIGALSVALAQPSPGNMQQLYALLRDESPLDYIDILMEKLPQEQRPAVLRDLLDAAYQQEPEEKVRERLREALARKND